MSSWQLRSVSKSFFRDKSSVQALRQVDLQWDADELLVVFGPHGSGKTTLLRILAGLESPDSGEVFHGGQPVTRISPEIRDVAMVFNPMAVYPHLSVLDNITFALKSKILPMIAPEAIQRAQEIAHQLGLGDKLQRFPNTLSGGEQQRVALARTLVRRPKLFLMDEPLVKLDAKLRERVRSLLKHIHRETRIPMIYATHDSSEAMQMADKLVVLDQGKILQSGPPEQLYQRPTHSRVAQLLGYPSINLFPGSHAEEMGFSPQKGAFAAIRPESFNFFPEPNGAGRLISTEKMGRTECLVVQVGKYPIRILYSGESGLAPGTPVRLQVDDRDVIWLKE